MRHPHGLAPVPTHPSLGPVRFASAVAVVLLAAASASLAGSVTIPNSPAYVGGNYIPFAWGDQSTPIRYQQVYRASAFGTSDPVDITSMSFFHYFTTWQYVPRDTMRFDSTVTFATLPNHAVTTDLDANLALHQQTTFQGIIDLYGSAPTIQMQQPYTYDPAAGSLVVDLRIDNPGRLSQGASFAMQATTTPLVSRLWTTGYPAVGMSYDYGLVTEFTTGPASPSVSPLEVCFRYDVPATVDFEAVPVWYSSDPRISWTPTPDTSVAEVPSSDRPEFEQEFLRIFRDSLSSYGIADPVRIVDQPGPDTVNVYFSQKIDSLAAEGFAYDVAPRNGSDVPVKGVDRFNERPDGNVAVFVRDSLQDRDWYPEFLAMIAAHEVGHSQGLWHVPSGAVMEDEADTSNERDFENHVYRADGLFGHSSNPVYHLLAYTYGMSDAELRALGVLPGTYDVPWYRLPWLSYRLVLDALSAISVFDLVLEQDMGMDGWIPIAHLDELSPGDVYTLLAPEGSRLRLLGSSTPGGPVDLLLSLDGSGSLEWIADRDAPGTGAILRYDPVLGTGQRIAEFQYRVSPVPEPSTAITTVVAFLALGWMVRRRGR
jgi:hypothetical protein